MEEYNVDYNDEQVNKAFHDFAEKHEALRNKYRVSFTLSKEEAEEMPQAKEGDIWMRNPDIPNNPKQAFELFKEYFGTVQFELRKFLFFKEYRNWNLAAITAEIDKLNKWTDEAERMSYDEALNGANKHSPQAEYLRLTNDYYNDYRMDWTHYNDGSTAAMVYGQYFLFYEYLKQLREQNPDWEQYRNERFIKRMAKYNADKNETEDSKLVSNDRIEQTFRFIEYINQYAKEGIEFEILSDKKKDVTVKKESGTFVFTNVSQTNEDLSLEMLQSFCQKRLTTKAPHLLKPFLKNEIAFLESFHTEIQKEYLYFIDPLIDLFKSALENIKPPQLGKEITQQKKVKPGAKDFSLKEIAIAYHFMEIPITKENAAGILEKHSNLKSVEKFLAKRISKTSELTKPTQNKTVDTKHLNNLTNAKRLISGLKNTKAETNIDRAITAFRTAYDSIH